MRGAMATPSAFQSAGPAGGAGSERSARVTPVGMVVMGPLVGCVCSGCGAGGVGQEVGDFGVVEASVVLVPARVQARYCTGRRGVLGGPVRGDELVAVGVVQAGDGPELHQLGHVLDWVVGGVGGGERTGATERRFHEGA